MGSGIAAQSVLSAGVGIRPASLPALLTEQVVVAGDEVALSYLDYRERVNGVQTSWTWRQLDERVTTIAVHLRDRITPGQPVAVLAGQTPDYIAAFLGALRAGAVAVPLFTPDLPGHGGRLAAVLADCRPTVVLTTARDLAGVTAFVPDAEALAVDTLPAATGEFELPGTDDLAYLQYTSGSTGDPRGVMITHGNVVVNAEQALDAYGLVRGRSVTVSWLPLFHDMGLVLSVAAPVVRGVRTVLMDPLAFVERPERWLRALSANPSAVSAAPTFAYAFAAARVSEAEKARLRLDTVGALIDGSEPVQPGAIRKFLAAFGPCGLRPEAHRPSYGLAEATVFVSTSVAGRPPVLLNANRGALADGRIVAGTEDAITLVSCGTPLDQQARIVDPATGVVRPDGEVGEIWLSGANIGQGYWGKPADSVAVFGNRLDGSPDRWLRTGDLGVRHDGELYVTGRIKDLIIVDGRNHYPHDVEHTAEQAHPAIRRRNVVAFAVPTADGERAVVLAERAKDADPVVGVEVSAAVRAAVSARHGLALYDVVLVEPDSLPRTSSGKIARSTCRDRYLAEAARP